MLQCCRFPHSNLVSETWFTMIRLCTSAVLICLYSILLNPNAKVTDTLLAAPQQATEAELVSDQWQIVLIGDQRIGYGRTTIRKTQQNSRPIFFTRSESKIKIKRFQQEIRMQTILKTQETADGQLLSFEQITKNPPAATSRMSGQVQDNELIMQTEIAGRKTVRKVPWQADVKSPAYLDRLLMTTPLRANQVIRYKTFFPDYAKIGKISLSAAHLQYTKTYQGAKQNALLVRMTESVQPTLSTQLYVDTRGNTLKSQTDLLGRTMTTFAVPEEIALQHIAGTELDLAVDTLIRVKPIANPHQSKKIVYRIKGHDIDVSEHLKSTSTQTIKKLDDHTCELTVRAIALPQRATIEKVDSLFLAETNYLQISDYEVIQHARRAAGAEINPARIARKMERYVHDKIRVKNFSTALASAAEVAEQLEGDCTEHAVLLAAMLRVKKIPSRIATGLIYIPSRSSFGGHMWTEAYLNNQWIPLDATLGRGGIGAAHIKLSDSSLNDHAPAPVTAFLPLLNLIGKIEINVVKVDSAR